MNREIQILRAAVVKLTQLLAGKGLTVTQRGTGAYVKTDKSGKPTLVNIPHIPDNASEQLILAIQGFIDHEVAHILFTDFKCSTTAGSEGCHGSWNIIEDTFIERMMAKKFPGTAYNLERLYDFFLEQITLPALAKASDEREALGTLIVPICRAWAGQKRFDDFLHEHKFWDIPLVQEFVERMEPVRKKIATIRNSQEALEIGRFMHEVLRPPPKPPADEEPGEGEEGKSEPGEESEDKGGSKGPSSEGEGSRSGDEYEEADAPAPEKKDEPEADDKKPATEPDKQPKADTSDEKGGDGDVSEEASGRKTDEGRDEEEGEEGSEAASETKDEAESDGAEEEHSPFEDAPIDPEDFVKQLRDKIEAETLDTAGSADYIVWTKDLDVIEVFQPKGGYRDEWLTQLDDKTSHLIAPMQKEIERMMASRNRVLYTPGLPRGRMHAASLHKIAVNDDRIFRQRQETKALDTIVSLLIDNSGSMARNDRIVMAMSAAYALSQTLERVRVPHEVLGFTTKSNSFGGKREGYTHDQMDEIKEAEHKLGRYYARHEPLYMPIFKTVDERLTPTVRKRFAAAPEQLTLAENVDGECIEIAAQRLLMRPEKRKVLIVLSDGMPSGAGTGPEECIKHTKQIVPKIEAMGVETIGIGIETNSVAKFYKRHITLSNVEALPQLVMGQLKQILLTK